MNGQENNNYNGMGYNGQPMNDGMMNNNPNMMNEQQMMSNQGMMQQQPMQQPQMQPPMQQPMNDNMQYANEQQYVQMQQQYNQGMMPQQGLPPMQSDGEFAGAVLPVVNQEPIMQQAPVLVQPIVEQPVAGQYASNPRTIKGFLATGAGKVVIMLCSLVVLILLLFIFGHKTLSCTQEMDAGEFVAVITRETEYWFGNATSIKAIMEIDLEDLDEDEKEQVIQYVKDLAEEYESDNVTSKVKTFGDNVTLTSRQKVSDDSKIGSLKDEKAAAIEDDFVCK